MTLPALVTEPRFPGQGRWGQTDLRCPTSWLDLQGLAGPGAQLPPLCGAVGSASDWDRWEPTAQMHAGQPSTSPDGWCHGKATVQTICCGHWARVCHERVLTLLCAGLASELTKWLLPSLTSHQKNLLLAPGSPRGVQAQDSGAGSNPA